MTIDNMTTKVVLSIIITSSNYYCWIIIITNGAKKDKKGNWICSDCQTESLNRHRIKRLGINHPDCQGFIGVEDRKVRRHNDAARRLNEVLGQYLMQHKRNTYLP